MSEAFLRALADAFARNRASTGRVEIALAALLAAVLALQLVALARRRRRRWRRLRDLAAAHGIGAEDLRFARGLARAQGLAPLALLTHVDRFERATARALAGTPGAGPGDPAAAERIHRLRHALGFDRLPAHTPLLTTRELSPGLGVELGRAHGVVIGVDETSLAVELRGEPPPTAPGGVVALHLVHAREARYELGCRLRERRGGAGGPVLVLAHDEAPRRVQQRDFQRVAARTAVALHALPPWPSPAAVPLDVVARLVDVSGGGARVVSRAALPVGLLTRATFTLGADRFEGLPAVVLAAEPVPGGAFRAHLEWGRLPEAERSRLVAAVSRLELLGAAEERAPHA